MPISVKRGWKAPFGVQNYDFYTFWAKKVPYNLRVSKSRSIFASLLNESSPPKEIWKGGRVVDYSGLENRRAERHRGFESLPFRHRAWWTIVHHAFLFYSYFLHVTFIMFIRWPSISYLGKLVSFPGREAPNRLIHSSDVNNFRAEKSQCTYFAIAVYITLPVQYILLGHCSISVPIRVLTSTAKHLKILGHLS